MCAGPISEKALAAWYADAETADAPRLRILLRQADARQARRAAQRAAASTAAAAAATSLRSLDAADADEATAVARLQERVRVLERAELRQQNMREAQQAQREAEACAQRAAACARASSNTAGCSSQPTAHAAPNVSMAARQTRASPQPRSMKRSPGCSAPKSAPSKRDIVSPLVPWYGARLAACGCWSWSANSPAAHCGARHGRRPQAQLAMLRRCRSVRAHASAAAAMAAWMARQAGAQL